ncbi:MAG: hypothetical protein ACKO3R_01300 [bacterium]
MRSLEHDLGKRSPLFLEFNAGVSFNPRAYTAFDFNKTPVPENLVLASPAAAPGNTPGNTPGNPPEAFFTSSVNNPNTAYSFYNNVSLKPWTPADSANAWAGLGAEPLSFGTDGNIKFDSSSDKPLNVYEEANRQNAETEEQIAESNAKRQEANAKNTEKLLLMLGQLFQLVAKALSDNSDTA